ncbi:carboxypeptidase-like regulatory domain-containing protein [Granulicella sp. S156]|uniref:carboxypeptidase-like regulatory domain-containing protein n=1 Tax=Granulicella sp. S156 TaxID=1747224 RepID=UPI00131EA306|nr:carboxypeptidase-like regulatory domain-containing protein [Granulicella sp. S156]
MQNSTDQAFSAKRTASVSGTVQDTTGAAIPGAKVTLKLRDGTELHQVPSGPNGEFTFTRLVAGSYSVAVHANGFTPFTSAEFTLTEHQAYLATNITLSVASAITEVTVRPIEVIAAEQIKQEERQRLLGVIPNFYVSYVPDPVPMTTKQKFSLAARDTLDWTSFVGISFAAGIEQANNNFAGYGQGSAGYAKRWAAQFGDGRSSDFFGHAIFPSLFHQDPRYFYQGTGTKKSRLMHALSHAFIARGDDGHTMPNYSYLFGDMVSGALSNAYYPHANRGAKLVFTNSLLGIAGLAGSTVAQEFIGKRVTKNASTSTQPATPPPPRNSEPHAPESEHPSN